MSFTSAWMIAATAALATSALAEPVPSLPEATRVLTAMYPGVRVAWDQGRITHLYGAPMTWGGTPDAAAGQWLQLHSAAFGAGPLTLRSLWSTPVKNDRFTAYGYEQFIDGMPVEYGGVQVLVLNGPVPRVVYAAGHPAAKPAAGWADAAMTGAEAVAMVRAMPLFRHLTSWTTPQAVVWQGEGTWTAATRAWKFMGEVPKPNDSTDQRFTFFVDVATGTLLFARNEVLNTDVNGTVKGMGTPGTNPDIASNPPVALNMPEIRMSIAGGNSAFSDRDGNFTIPNPGTAAVTVTSNVSSGRWVNVNPTGLTELNVNGPATPGVSNPFTFNSVPGGVNSQTTAQVNAFIHATLTHNYYKDRAPGFTSLDIVIPANTGVAGACNAFYNASTINFFNAGSSGGTTCNNTSYSSVVAHEYGHFVVAARGGLAQGAFGEGLGDVTGMLMYDDPIIGRNFTVTGGIVRDPIGANIQYPCSGSCGGEIHCCGQILGGVWWRIRTNLGAVLGSGPGLDEARDLQVAWMMITGGGQPGTANSAWPQTAIEVLTVDDNDGNLGNGTPHYPSICAAFDAHSIDCPPLQLVTFQYPTGRPQLLTPNQATAIRVDIIPLNGTPTPNSGTVSYSVNGGTFQTAPMAVLGPNQYEATIPAIPCQSIVRYYFGVGTTQGLNVTDPASAPGTSFSAPSATAVTVALNDTFETNLGWSGVAPDDTATSGRWNRMDPQPTAAQPGDDVTPAPGVNCWVTDGVAGASIGERDVDNGKTTLTSPLLNLNGQPGARVSYWRWYSNTQGGAPNADVFTVDVSNNDGATWTNVETVGPAGAQANGGWFQHEFRVADFVPPTASVRVRFVASDFGTGSLVEAAVDDVLVSSLSCAAVCYADCDQDGALTVTDFGCFQTKFVIADPYADCNADSVLNVADFGCFQTKFVAGCP